MPCHDDRSCTGQLEPGHRRSEIAADQVRNRRRALARFRQVAASAPSDPGDAVLARQPGHPAPTGHDPLALELPGDPLGTVGGTRRVDRQDQFRQPPVVVSPRIPLHLGSDPRVIAAVIGRQHPAQPSDAEPIPADVDERETLARRSVVDQRLSGIAQDVVSIRSDGPDLGCVEVERATARSPLRIRGDLVGEA